MKSIRWGIIGTGYIARRFAEGLKVLGDARLVAVGSRTREGADQFANSFGIPNRHVSYEALARDPEVDVVYVATPHPLHHSNTLMCLEHGKHVLCEKPFAVNARLGEEMVARARERKLFLMEAMWTRFFPLMVEVRRLLRDGAIGEVRMVTADFGFRAEADDASRLLNPELAGGALLDVGIYPIALAYMVFGGPPKTIVSAAHLGNTGVDEQSAYTFTYENGQLALLSSAVRTETPQEARIMGTEGTIYIHPPFWQPSRYTLIKPGKKDEVVDVPFEGNGFNYEAREVMECIRAGRLESATMPLAETLEIARTMDAIREQWGLRYPME